MVGGSGRAACVAGLESSPATQREAAAGSRRCGGNDHPASLPWLSRSEGSGRHPATVSPAAASGCHPRPDRCATEPGASVDKSDDLRISLPRTTSVFPMKVLIASSQEALPVILFVSAHSFSELFPAARVDLAATCAAAVMWDHARGFASPAYKGMSSRTDSFLRTQT